MSHRSWDYSGVVPGARFGRWLVTGEKTSAKKAEGVSNFNLEEFPLQKEIIAGPEVVNGTGQVSLRFYDGDTLATCFLMDYEEVLSLADWLAGHAFEAMKQQWREHHILTDGRR